MSGVVRAFAYHPYFRFFLSLFFSTPLNEFFQIQPYAFAKRQRLLSPEQYEIVEVRTSRGVSRVMLFSKAIIRAEWEANAPLREAMATKRERWRAKRAAMERAAKQRPSK